MSPLYLFTALMATLLTPLSGQTPVDEGVPPLRMSIKRESARLTPEQRRRADQIISVFENDTPDLQYDYTEELEDGRGLTAGRAGFTTATGDLILVVQRYVARTPDSPLKQYLPRLEEAAKTEDGSMEGLEGLGDAWHEAAKDPDFCAAQDEVVEELYFRKAAQAANLLGVRSPLGQLYLYDAIIQHGNGEDPDGLPALIQRTTERAGGTPKSGIPEAKWLDLFLAERRATLAHAYAEETREVWAESVGRCDALQSLAQAGNYDLHGPIVIKPFDTEHTIE